MEKEIKELQASIKETNDSLKAFAEQATALAKDNKQLSAEAKAQADKLLKENTEMNARLDQLEKIAAGLMKPEGEGVPLSFAAQVTEDESVKAMLAAAAKGAKTSVTVNVNAAITNDNIGDDVILPQRVPGVVTPPQMRLTIRDLLNWGTTASNAITFIRETGFTNNADVVSENPSGGKPESTLAFEQATEAVATIAHFVHASKQVLDDMPMLRSYLTGRLTYGLKLKEESQLLKGSGTNGNLNGIFTQATAYANPGVTVTNETAIDRLRLAMLQVVLAEYSADGIVLNPIDWAAIELLKDTTDRYIFTAPGVLATPTLWGLPVVATTAMDAGDFLMGAFRMGAQGWDRETLNVTIATQDQDDFIKNMVKILIEERIGLTVYRPESFVKGDFTFVS